MAVACVFQQIIDPANRANPYPLYAELRRTPVTREDDGTYVVSTYREIVGLLHDPRVSSDERSPGRSDSQGQGGERDRPPSFIGLDPPEHDRVRRLMNRHFGPPETPDRVDGMRPGLAELVTGLVDRLDGRSQIDLVDDFAYPFPVTVICELLGVPREDERLFHGWADAVVEAIAASGAEQGERNARRETALTELGEYLGHLADTHRRDPGTDLLSELATDDGAHGRLTRAELMSHASLLLIAGHETTVNLITNGMLTLLRHPTVLDRIRQEPTYVIRTVEELLRYEPPVHFLPWRVALDDIDVAGTTIPAGSHITLALAAGSRDPAHVRDPDRFDPDRFGVALGPDRFEREGNQHLGFGGGIHHCFGAPLARLEAQIALTELARRLESPRLLADPPPYRPSPVLRGPRHLPIGIDGVAPSRRVPRAREAADQPATERTT
jgi:cytochrome P450